MQPGCRGPYLGLGLSKTLEAGTEGDSPCLASKGKVKVRLCLASNGRERVKLRLVVTHA